MPNEWHDVPKVSLHPLPDVYHALRPFRCAQQRTVFPELYIPTTTEAKCAAGETGGIN